ncbi:MAG: pyridoxal phosphate-dependent aminotransferase [Bulleidia sp.]
MEMNALVCTSLREKPETARTSRKSAGKDIGKLIRMGLNENVFGMSPKALAAIRQADEEGSYYQDWTQKDLKAAIMEHYGVGYDMIVTGSGSSSLIDALGTAFLDPGDELLLCMPTFPAIIDTAEINGASVKTIPLREDLSYDLDGLLSAITEKTKMVYFCNPNNPTGTYVGIDALTKFADACPDHVIQVYDEAYIEFVEAEDCLEMTEEMKARKDKPIIQLKTFSKFYGMAGLRAGYALAQPELIAWLKKCGTEFSMSRASMAGAAAAIRDREHAAYVKESVAASRHFLEKGLEELGCRVIPSETNFIFFDAGMDPEEIMEKMMEKGILMSAQAGACRISVHTIDTDQLFLQFLKEILGK